MIRGIDPDWARAIGRWAAGKSKVREVYLYGSRVEGTDRPDSDLDVALLIEPDDESALTTWIFDGQEWAEELAELLPVPLHLEMMDPSDHVVWPAVKEHGRLVYTRLSQA